MPKNVVITGGTRGLGLAMTAEFLERGHRVVISDRQADSLRAAVDGFAIYADRIAGCSADIRRPADSERLWAEAVGRFGMVDIWINHAGAGQGMTPLHELPAEDLVRIFETELLGPACACRTVLRGMLTQGHGQLFNMEGLGSDGRHRPGLTVYGAARRGLRYLTEGLVNETRGGPVKVGSLCPGTAADKPQAVARFLAARILADPPHGAHIARLSPLQLPGRLLSALVGRR
jgi:NAD(P)-dependent dehydrogenase (short-subunit alcohol dehydrogenase family)